MKKGLLPMRVLTLACCLAVASLGSAVAQTATTTAKPAAKGARTVEIVVGDNMKFDKTEIPAKPGETLRVVLKNTGVMQKVAMGHNFVLLKQGVDQVEFNTAAFGARETDFIPPSMKASVIANTTLTGGGEVAETTFTVPAKAGTYPYLCSFPGHFALGMRGTLIVK
jgi:azurin